MTWDEDVIEGTIHEVKNVEEKVIALAKGKKKLKPSAVEQLVYQIIEGDCTLIRGILTFTKMTLKGYVKVCCLNINFVVQRYHNVEGISSRRDGVY